MRIKGKPRARLLARSHLENEIKPSDLSAALENWDIQRDNVALVQQAVSRTLPLHGLLVRSFQSQDQSIDEFASRIEELQLDSVERLATDLRELARLARRYFTLRVAYEGQQFKSQR